MVRLALLAAFALSLSGCLILPRGVVESSGAVSSSRPSCDHNQEWDGEHCRHKGKGSGARKHDD